MGPTEEDKADVKAFHDASQGVGLKRNYRDASNTSVSDGSLSLGTKTNAWRNAATPINIPTNSASTPSTSGVHGEASGPKPVPKPHSLPYGAMNPFSRRMNTNVHSSRATVLSQASPNKTRGELSNRSSNRTATMTQSRFFSPQAKLPTNHRPENRNTYSFVPPSAEIIEVKDDEDIGEPVKISRKSPARRFSSPDPIDVIGKDGDATKRLKEKVQKHSNAHEGHRKRVPPSLAASDSLESIEDASTFDQNDGGREMKPPSGFASGSVRKLVDRFEANGALQQPIREIDLSKSLKRRMKPKITSTVLGIVQQDPGATSASGFTSGKKITKKSLPTELGLPLVAWIEGLKRHDSTDDSPYWLFVDRQKLLSVRRGPDIVFDMELTREGLEIEMTDLPWVQGTVAVLKIKTHGTSSGSRRRNSYFNYGSSGDDGAVTFNFLTNHANWQNGQGLVDLRTMIVNGAIRTAALRGKDCKGAWERAENAVDFVREGSPEVAVSAPPSLLVRSELTTPARRHSQRLARSVKAIERQTEVETASPPPPDQDEVILVYPPTGTGAVRITKGDLNRLAPGQYLNDTLIEYGLKLLLDDIRQTRPELADQIHVFSSFFYKKLNIKSKEQGYQSVRKWTSRIDIFSKKYIVVPINENLHWYLAIICNPGCTLHFPTPSSPPNSRHMTRNRTREVGGHVPDVVPTEVPRDVTELSESTSASVVGRKSPDIVPDSEEEFERTQPVTMERGRDETKDEHEVESMIRSCSIHDNTAGPLQSPKFPSSPNAMWIDEEQGVEPLQLQYPDSSDQEQMERTSPEAVTFGLQSSEGETDGPKSAIKLNRISTESFYQSISAKGKEKEISHQLPPVEPPVPDEDEPVTPEAADAGAQVPHIFTFDSLGSAHTQTINVLTGYLRMEAKDKKGLEETMVTKAKGKKALVPFQPNFCDCGVYVLHFVKRFMEDPIGLSHTILTKATSKDNEASVKGSVWRHEEVDSIRNALITRTGQLAREWKQIDAKKSDVNQANGGEGSNGVSVIDDSDDEPIIVEELSVPPVSGRGRGKRKAVSPELNLEESPAERIRNKKRR